MAGFLFTLFIYIVGGVTFIPLLICGILLHVHLTCPHINAVDPPAELLRDNDDEEAVKDASAGLDEKFKVRGAQENDVSAGYFAVSREYVPGGVGAKPPERTTPTGSTTISSPSPSVYQSMYRSLFDRKPTTSPIDNKGAQRPIKKGGNIFYVVLRYTQHLDRVMTKGNKKLTYITGTVTLCSSTMTNNSRSDMSSAWHIMMCLYMVEESIF